MDLTIIIYAADSSKELERVAQQLPLACSRLPSGTQWEVIICTGGKTSVTVDLPGIPVAINETRGGYGAAVRLAIEGARGKFIVTMEAGLAHSPYIIPELYAAREIADVIIGSRFIGTGYCNGTWARRKVSRVGNKFFRWVLDFPAKDLTSSFRLYNRRVFQEVKLDGGGYESLLEILVKAYAQGFRVKEIPFHHFPRARGVHDQTIRVGSDALASIYRLWKLRNSIDCADYDERAFRSRVWFQRSWQQRRYHALIRMARNSNRVLDVGCGSSQVIEGLPQSDCCDVRMNKLRHKRAPGRLLAKASVFDLPYKSELYDAVVFSQVIEHIPRDPKIMTELVRVTKPGGYVIIGTPDYATWWTTIEKIYGAVHPGGYADEHITHYTFASLKEEVEQYGCTFVDHAYVWHAELIMRFRKNA